MKKIKMIRFSANHYGVDVDNQAYGSIVRQTFGWQAYALNGVPVGCSYSNRKAAAERLSKLRDPNSVSYNGPR